ncbi:MAG: class I SAM-dependent methyltransferase [Candidatus Zhuqueibacterota bacterium]
MGFTEKLMEQGRKPYGVPGRIIGYLMNLSHRSVYKWGLGCISPGNKAIVLDIGCGGGEVVKSLAMNTPEGKIYGLDHSSEMVGLARRVNQTFVDSGRVEINHGIVSSLPYSDNKFDIVTAFETIQFWPNLDADLREVKRVLKPLGELLIVNRYPDLEGRNADWAEFLQIRSSKEYQERLNNAGYRDISIDDGSKAGWIMVSAKKP